MEADFPTTTRQHPTPLQGTFQVVFLDFSRASGGSGSLPQKPAHTSTSSSTSMTISPT